MPLPARSQRNEREALASKAMVIKQVPTWLESKGKQETDGP
jgi:hypothetical protein